MTMDGGKESSELRRGEMSDDQTLLVECFLASLTGERNYSAHTVRAYKTDLNTFFHYANRQLFDPLAPTTRQLRGYLADQDKARYSRKTINRRLSALRSFFRWLNVSQRAASNAVSAVQGPKIPKHLPLVFSASELDALFDSLDRELKEAQRVTEEGKREAGQALVLRDEALFELLYASGARVSELAGLTCAQLDLSAGQLRLFGKGSKERIVPLHGQCIKVLQAYLETARPVLLAKRGDKKGGDAVFLSKTGRPLSADAIRKAFKAQMMKAGLDAAFSPHAMRHTFATDLLDGGADLRSVQELLGHASLSTTQIYTHLTPERLKAAHLQAHPRA